MTTPNSETIRKRAKNYSAEEEALLVDLVEAQKNCIECKKSDAVTWKQKEEAWRKIEAQFAATSGSSLHWKALRDKYEAIKRKSKVEMADLKLETYRTGGGVASTKVSTVSAKIASMLGDSVTGLKNIYDSDSIFEVDAENCMDFGSSIESVNQTQMTNEKVGYPNNSTPERNDWSSWKPSALKEKKSKELVVDAKRKRSLEDEKMELIILQQNFYRDENTRAQEKHEQELMSLKYKNELLQLELADKKAKM